jgi:hypothetical protein
VPGHPWKKGLEVSSTMALARKLSVEGYYVQRGARLPPAQSAHVRRETAIWHAYWRHCEASRINWATHIFSREVLMSLYAERRGYMDQ